MKTTRILSCILFIVPWLKLEIFILDNLSAFFNLKFSINSRNMHLWSFFLKIFKENYLLNIWWNISGRRVKFGNHQKFSLPLCRYLSSFWIGCSSKTRILNRMFEIVFGCVGHTMLVNLLALLLFDNLGLKMNKYENSIIFKLAYLFLSHFSFQRIKSSNCHTNSRSHSRWGLLSSASYNRWQHFDWKF